MSVYGRTHETGVPDALKTDNGVPAHLQGGDDDDWDTDPDYVNDISEKAQRWGSKEIIKPDVQSHEGGIEGVYKAALNQHEQATQTEYSQKKSLYGAGTGEITTE